MASSSDQMDVDGTEDRSRRATSVPSIDDLEAAQALEGLRSDSGQASPGSPAMSEPPGAEPILSLLTTSHPLLSTAINGSMSVYSSSKSYSPRFRSGAEFLERNIAPVANTVGSVGRKTGVETGLRWALQQRREAAAADAAAAGFGGSADQRFLDDPNRSNGEQADGRMDIAEKGVPESRRPSHTRQSSSFSTAETLHSYDNLSPPPGYYEKSGKLENGDRTPGPPGPPISWKGRLAISTSGLSVAMSEESLRSLAYCLTWLRWANTRLGNSLLALKGVLQEREAARTNESSSSSSPTGRPRSPTVVAQQIQQLKGEVLQTLKQVVDVVSRYAGGALPDNARSLVRKHLTSLPRRFRIAATSNMPADPSPAQTDTVTNARRAIVLAEEGLDMMAQVSGIVNNTLVSAEGWCDQLRKPKPSVSNADAEEGDGAQGADDAPPLLPPDAKLPVYEQEDAEMTGVSEPYN